VKKIYYRWSGGCKYEFYIDTGKHRNTTSDDPPFNVSLMININIVGGGKVSNKKGRLKKRLISPPSDFVIGTGVTWCLLNEEEKKHYIELEPNEFKKLLKTYDISEMRFLQ
jgi:hypothetical protein